MKAAPFFEAVAQKPSYLAVLPLASRARVLASHPYAFLAFLQETGLVHDEHPAPLISEVLHDVVSEIVAHEVRLPAGIVEEVLDPSRPRRWLGPSATSSCA